MKIILNLLLVIILASIVGVLSHVGSGHVLIFAGSYRIDLSLATTLLILLLLYIGLYLLIRFLINICNIPSRFNRWRSKSTLLESRDYLNLAGINYLESKYDNALKNAMRSADKEQDKDNKFLALMLAFKSASFIGNQDKEESLRTVIDSYTDKKWQLAKFMTNAELHYVEHKYGLCLDSLNLVLQLDKKHIPARIVMLKVFLHLNDFTKAYEVFNWLMKNNGLNKNQADKYRTHILEGFFLHTNDTDIVIQTYRKQENHNDIVINKAYLDGLIRLKQFPKAVELVESIEELKFFTATNTSLVVLAKKINEVNQAKKLLAVFEKHLIHNKQNAQLLLALGIISNTLGQWSSAQGYLESSLLLKPTMDGYVYLSIVADALGNNDLVLSTRQSLLQNIHNLV